MSSTVRESVSAVLGGVVFLALFVALGIHVPAYCFAAEIAAGAGTYCVCRTWLPKRNGEAGSTDDDEEPSIQEQLCRLQDLGKKSRSPIVSQQIARIGQSAGSIAAYLQKYRMVEVEPKLMLKHYLDYTLEAAQQYLSLPKTDDETVREMSELLDSVASSFEGMYDQLCRKDLDSFQASVRLARDKIESLNPQFLRGGRK